MGNRCVSKHSDSKRAAEVTARIENSKGRKLEMFQKNQKDVCETETAFTFVLLLMNVLILAVIAGASWAVYFALAENNSLSVFLRGGFLYY